MYYRLEVLDPDTQEWDGLFRGDASWRYNMAYPEFYELKLKLCLYHKEPIGEIVNWGQENKSKINIQQIVALKREFRKTAQVYPRAKFYFTEKAMDEMGWILAEISKFPFVRLIETENLKILWESPYKIQVLAIHNMEVVK